MHIVIFFNIALFIILKKLIIASSTNVRPWTFNECLYQFNDQSSFKNMSLTKKKVFQEPEVASII